MVKFWPDGVIGMRRDRHLDGDIVNVGRPDSNTPTLDSEADKPEVNDFDLPPRKPLR